MNITLEISEQMLSWLHMNKKGIKCCEPCEISINGHCVSFVPIKHETYGQGWYPEHKFFLQQIDTFKSDEELSAELAVKKAEEALKAAKSVLEKVKESK